MIVAKLIGDGRPWFTIEHGQRRIRCTGSANCVGCCLDAWSLGVPNRNTRPTFAGGTTWPRPLFLEASRRKARRYFGVQS